MIAATRRNILALIGMAPTTAIGMKRALDARTLGLAAGGDGIPRGGQPISGADERTPDQMQTRAALQIPASRAQIRSILYEEQRGLNWLEPDLACLHSMSVNARLCYQRQRNVERRLAEMEKGWSWQRMNRAILGAIGLNWGG